MLTPFSKPTGAPFWFAWVRSVGAANWLRPSVWPGVPKSKVMLLGATPRLAAQTIPSCPAAAPALTGVRLTAASCPSPSNVTVPLATRPSPCVAVSTSAGSA
jgi:hypothetical protein